MVEGLDLGLILAAWSEKRINERNLKRKGRRVKLERKGMEGKGMGHSRF